MGLSKKAILVTVSSESVDKLAEDMEIATANIGDILRKESE